MPSHDDPFSLFGCHHALTISKDMPMSANNDLECFYANMKDGFYVNDKHAIYSFLLKLLYLDEYRKFSQQDLELLKTFNYQSNCLSLSTRHKKSERYTYHLCKRKTIVLKTSFERASL